MIKILLENGSNPFRVPHSKVFSSPIEQIFDDLHKDKLVPLFKDYVTLELLKTIKDDDVYARAKKAYNL